MKSQTGKGNTPPGGNLPVKAESNVPAVQNGQDHEVKVQPLYNGPLSVEETIKKVNQLNENISKRKILKLHQERLESMKFGEFDDKDCIILESSNGVQYPINSPVLCQKLVTVAIEEISAKIDEIEEQIVL